LTSRSCGGERLVNVAKVSIILFEDYKKNLRVDFDVIPHFFAQRIVWDNMVLMNRQDLVSFVVMIYNNINGPDA
jgi:hypothetical protein